MAEGTSGLIGATNDGIVGYAYFLLAASGAGSGLAVNQAQNLTLRYSMIPLALVALCLFGSFWAGCIYVRRVIAELRANAARLQVIDGSLRVSSPEEREIAREVLTKAQQNHGDVANRAATWQVNLLVAGAAAVVCWHVWEMYLRTVGR